jgi:ferredoxin
MSYIPTIDESSCIGHGDCMELVPEVFHVEDCARVIGTAPDEQILAAANECPVGAISIVDSETGEQIFP